VFARPQTGSEPAPVRVLEGPGRGDPASPEFVARRDAAFSTAMQAARVAAAEGLLKHTYVLDATHQLRVDARHGHVQRRERDEESLRKTMGGKARALRPDASAGLLREIGIMNADGTISARNARKYKQVNHLVQLCRPVWQAALEARETGDDSALRVLDLACGNSYLALVLAHVLDREAVPFRLVGIDARADVIERSRTRALALGFAERMSFSAGTIVDSGSTALERLDGVPDVVIALHACDTATDEALALAVRARATAILAAPCCQAELARQLSAHEAARGDLGAIERHGLLRRAYADVLTDALRVEVLEACGYTVALLEFVDSEHTPKNLLIRASRRGGVDPRALPNEALRRVALRCADLGVRPALLDLLTGP
jgi:SAM-dependent methyltransferase